MINWVIFQYSIGNADYIVFDVNGDVFEMFFQYSIGDARGFAVSRVIDGVVKLSILHWRCRVAEHVRAVGQV